MKKLSLVLALIVSVTLMSGCEKEPRTWLDGQFYEREGKVYMAIESEVLADVELVGANPKTLDAIGGGYLADEDEVFFYMTRVEGADRATFTVLPDGYARDVRGMYYNGSFLGAGDGGDPVEDVGSLSDYEIAE